MGCGCNKLFSHLEKHGPLAGDWLDGIAELSKSLQLMDIDASAYACLSALTLVSGKWLPECSDYGTSVDLHTH